MKNKKVLIYLYFAILFMIAAVTPHFESLWNIFNIFLLTIPIHAVIIGIFAGMKIKKRWYCCLIPLLLLLAARYLSYTHDPNGSGMINLMSERNYDLSRQYGESETIVELPPELHDPIGHTHEFDPVPLGKLALPYVGTPFCILSMYVSAAATAVVHQAKKKKEEKSENNQEITEG